MHIAEDYEFAIRSLQVRFRLLLFFIGVSFQSTPCTKVIIITVNRTITGSLKIPLEHKGELKPVSVPYSEANFPEKR